jgi:hypothetical protein
MKRHLKPTFITDLNDGKLNELVPYVKSDNTLDMEIREDYINIYYRGGNALKVFDRGNHIYDYHFDTNYLHPDLVSEINAIKASKSKLAWHEYFQLVKQAMDFYFTQKPNEEREYQQLVVRENNYSSKSNATDYFILDIEYNNHKNARFDIVAIEWESDASIRKLTKGYTPKLVVIEMKCGDGAIKGRAGIHKHIDDFDKFISNAPNVAEFKNEMLSVFTQKWQLGLIPCISGNTRLKKMLQPTKDWDDRLEFAKDVQLMFLIANHDPASSVLRTELDNLGDRNIKFITSNFIGYSLYKENVYDLNQFRDRFQSQI